MSEGVGKGSGRVDEEFGGGCTVCVFYTSKIQCPQGTFCDFPGHKGSVVLVLGDWVAGEG